ncbi:MAG: ABC transporter ATP-binding protein [Sterolibacteriaceae bacterium]|nr:ABC transporter ATP-binding protein [Sterolibacteriaceae bacterium]MBK9086742.1 ABC transporter ATP-binding protein [Sterolibacteriaceae bacterium]
MNPATGARRDPRVALVGTLLLAVALALVPFAVGAGAGIAWVRVIDFALLYIMLALGLNIVVGFAGLLDLGYIAFYAVGAYLYALLSSPHLAGAFPSLAPGLHWSMWAVLPLGALVAGGFGVILGAPTLRLRGDYLAIVTLGFGEIIRIFLNNLNRPVNLTNGPQGITQIDPIDIGGVSLGSTLEVFGIDVPSVYLYYYLFLAATLLVIFVSIRLEDSRIGRAWVAIREDEIAAKACGINTRNVKLLAFAMGASFGGVAGGLFAGFQQFVSPESFTLLESIMVLCMVVLGGMGHIPGVIFGGILLTLLPEALRYGAGPVQTALFGKVLIPPESLRMLLFGLALILVMLYRPAGLWPSAIRRREFAGADRSAEGDRG